MDLTLPNASKLGGSVCIFFTQPHFFTTWLEINVRSHFSALSCNFKKQNWGINSQLKSNAAITKMQPTVRRCIASCCILTAVAVTWPPDAFPVKWAVKQISGWNARARGGAKKRRGKKMGGKKRGSGGKIWEHCFRARTGLIFLQMHDPTLISIRFPTSGSGGTVRRWGVNGGKMGKWKGIRGRLIGKGGWKGWNRRWKDRRRGDVNVIGSLQ